MGTLHDELAVADGIFDEIQELIRSNPSEVDGLTLVFLGRIARTKGDSSTLHLPRNREAREKTIRLLGEETPGIPIEGRDGYEIYREPETPGNSPAMRR